MLEWELPSNLVRISTENSDGGENIKPFLKRGEGKSFNGSAKKDLRKPARGINRPERERRTRSHRKPNRIGNACQRPVLFLRPEREKVEHQNPELPPRLTGPDSWDVKLEQQVSVPRRTLNATVYAYFYCTKMVSPCSPRTHFLSPGWFSFTMTDCISTFTLTFPASSSPSRP